MKQQAVQAGMNLQLCISPGAEKESEGHRSGMMESQNP